MVTPLQRIADRGILDEIRKQIDRERSRNRPEPNDPRLLRRDRTNSKIAQIIRKEFGKLTPAQQREVDREIEQARRDANAVKKEIDRRSAGRTAPTDERDCNISTRVIVNMTDNQGNVMTFPLDIDGMCTGDAAEIWDRIKAVADQLVTGKYTMSSERVFGAGRRGSPKGSPGTGGWKPLSYDIISQRIKE